MLAFVLWIAQGVIVPVVVSAFVSFLIVTVKHVIDRVPGVGPLLPDPITFTLAFVVIVAVLFGLGAVVTANVEQVITRGACLLTSAWARSPAAASSRRRPGAS